MFISSLQFLDLTIQIFFMLFLVLAAISIIILAQEKIGFSKVIKLRKKKKEYRDSVSDNQEKFFNKYHRKNKNQENNNKNT